jgi:hypothetical protein
MVAFAISGNPTCYFPYHYQPFTDSSPLWYCWE